MLYELKDLTMPMAMCYSADSRRFYVTDAAGVMHGYETKGYTTTNQWSLSFVPDMMIASSNDYFVALANREQVLVVNQETGSIRSSLTGMGIISAIAFSDDASQLGVLTREGYLDVYDTRDFSLTKQYSINGNTTVLAFHPEGKYITVLADETKLYFLNQTDETDRPFLVDEEKGVNYLRYVRDGKRQTYLTYNTGNAIKYKILKGLAANYSKMLADELNARMNEWSKMRPDETVEEYKLRVNAETRVQQALLFEQEIATRMADDLVVRSSIKLGSYNLETNMLTLQFDNMPQIYLTVPEQELVDFEDTANLEFRDAIYGLTANDKFELIYANVYNNT